MLMKRLIPLLILIVVMASCSPIKRFNRLVDKHPYLLTIDTVYVHDTVSVIVPEVKHDTAFIETELHDTVFIEKERLKIKLWEKHDTIYVEGECEGDTIVKTIEIPVPVKYYETSKWWHKIPWWVYLLAIAGTLYYLYKRFRKIIFPEN
jgi:hypothetical protein